MKFLAIGAIVAFMSTSCEAAPEGNLRNLQRWQDSSDSDKDSGFFDHNCKNWSRHGWCT